MASSACRNRIIGYLDLHGSSTIRSQCCSESLAILSALAIRRPTFDYAHGSRSLVTYSSIYPARTQCLTTLLELNTHEHIIHLIRTFVPASTSHALSSTTIHPLLPPAIRALKSLYIAISDLVDPLGASSLTYELIVECALSKINPHTDGTGKKTASSLLLKHNLGKDNPQLPASKDSASLGGRLRTDRDAIDDFAEQIFLVRLLLSGLSVSALADTCAVPMFQRDNEADLLLSLLDDACRNMDTSQDVESSLISARAQSAHVIRDICEIVSKCTKSPAQKDAIFNVPIQLPSTGTSSSKGSSTKMIDPTSLLFGILGRCANQVSRDRPARRSKCCRVDSSSL